MFQYKKHKKEQLHFSNDDVESINIYVGPVAPIFCKILFDHSIYVFETILIISKEFFYI